jgi:hypothetical protein
MRVYGRSVNAEASMQQRSSVAATPGGLHGQNRAEARKRRTCDDPGSMGQLLSARVGSYIHTCPPLVWGRVHEGHM